MDELKVIVSWPAKELSPNWRGHWAVKAREKRWARAGAASAARGAIATLVSHGKLAFMQRKLFWKNATALCVCYAKDRRRRDRDNLLASLKATFDGLVDAWVLEDDAGLIHLPLEIKLDRENPRVEITIKPIEGASP